MEVPHHESDDERTYGSGRERFRIVADDDTNHVHVGDILRDAPPEAADLLVPEDYTLTPTNTYWLKSYNGVRVPHPVATAPILILGRLRDIETGDEHLRLAWPRDGWQQLVESRATLMNGPELVKKLAGKGFPVNSGSAGNIARYLDAFEQANLEQLPLERVSRHLGWQGDRGKYGFLWGQTHLASHIDGTPVTFRGASTGDEQIARGFRTGGSIEGWINGIAPIARYPKALLGFYAAFVPPLLDILDCPNFIVDWSARTSTGKTTVLRIAASVAGNPNEDATDSVVGTWDTTRVAVERRCGLLTGLPVILDDTKKAKKPADVGDILYGIASGQGRQRGNLEGQERTQTWRTVLLSTGEASAVGFTTAGGTRGRVLSLRGLPFDSAEVSSLVQQLNTAVTSHYGHALPLFVRAVLERCARWSDWQQSYQKERARLAKDATNNVADRLAAYFAAITFTAKLVHRVFAEAGHPLPWQYTNQLDALWKQLAAETDEAAVDIRALQDVMSWAYASRGRFYSGHSTSNSLDTKLDPLGGWLGRWEDGDYIAFFQDKLKKYLEEQNYHPEEVLSGWRERGWLQFDKEGKHKQISWPLTGGKIRMIVLGSRVFDSTATSERPEDKERKEAG